MNSIFSHKSEVAFSAKGYERLHELLTEKRYSKIFVIVDTNTHELCLPAFLGMLQTTLDIEIIEIPEGETNKNIETCSGVWSALSELEADRKAIILNLGGGVVTDLGGFIACTFKRGIDFINIPTSLLAMVDASVGGKTGVDLGSLKNQIGVISEPLLVLIDVLFLDTLSAKELRSGLAEMYKHGLIADKRYWDALAELSELNIDDLEGLIYDSVIIKNTIVLEDQRELGVRKTLNFGHTLGHAIESYLLTHATKQRLLHGEAIAIGMVLESYLSRKRNALPQAELEYIAQVFTKMYEETEFTTEDITAIIDLMKHDKKNDYGRINFVLLNKIGSATYDEQVDNSDIMEAFNFYKAQY